MSDNVAELEGLRASVRPAAFAPADGGATRKGLATFTPQNVLWTVPGFLEPTTGELPRLDILDNLAHGHTTAHLVEATATDLGLFAYLHVHIADAFEFAAASAKVCFVASDPQPYALNPTDN